MVMGSPPPGRDDVLTWDDVVNERRQEPAAPPPPSQAPPIISLPTNWNELTSNLLEAAKIFRDTLPQIAAMRGVQASAAPAPTEDTVSGHPEPAAVKSAEANAADHLAELAAYIAKQAPRLTVRELLAYGKAYADQAENLAGPMLDLQIDATLGPALAQYRPLIEGFLANASQLQTPEPGAP